MNPIMQPAESSALLMLTIIMPVNGVKPKKIETLLYTNVQKKGDSKNWQRDHKIGMVQ